jgi:hypothetical protein
MNTGRGDALTAEGAITPNGGGLYTDGPVMLTGDCIGTHRTTAPP